MAFDKLLKDGIIKNKHMNGNISEVGKHSAGYFTKDNKHVGVVKTVHHIYIEDSYVK